MEYYSGAFVFDRGRAHISQVVVNGKWNLFDLSFLFPPNLLGFLQATPLRFLFTREDVLSWEGNPKGKLDIRSAYRLALENDKQLPLFEGWWIWKLNTLPRIKVFLWKCAHSSLQSKVCSSLGVSLKTPGVIYVIVKRNQFYTPLGTVLW